jgi:serine/threonine protein kinase
MANVEADANAYAAAPTGKKGRIEVPVFPPGCSVSCLCIDHNGQWVDANVEPAVLKALVDDSLRAGTHVFKRFFRKGIVAKQDYNNEVLFMKELSTNVFGNVEDRRKYTAIHGLDLHGTHEIIGLQVQMQVPGSSGTYYIVNQRGSFTLEDVVAATVTEKQLAQLTVDILESLELLQGKKIAHGDIKPDNLMYFEDGADGADGADGRWKLIDWEYSRSLDYAQLSKSSMLSKDRKLGSHPMYFDIISSINVRKLNASLRVVGKSFSESYVTQLMLPRGNGKELEHFLALFRASWDQYASKKAEAVAKGFGNEFLFGYFNNTTDLHSLGLVIYAIAHRMRRTKLSKTVWKSFCKRMFEFTDNMLLDARKALAAFRELSNDQCVFQRGQAETATVYTTCCDIQTPDMLCGQLDSQRRHDKFTLWIMDGGSVRPVVASYDEVARLIANDRAHVAKQFLKNGFAMPNTNLNNFNKEIQNLAEVGSIYVGASAAAMTALPKITFNGKLVYGMVSNPSSFMQPNAYYVFNEKGLRDIDESPIFDANDMRVLLDDVLSSLRVLHGKAFIHGDLKTGNVMEFGKAPRYRLIDWGKLKKVDRFDADFNYYGSERAGSPIAFYFSTVAKLLPTYAQRRNFALERVKSVNKTEIATLMGDATFSARYAIIIDAFRALFDEYKDNATKLFDEWKYNIDLFGLGMTGLYIMKINGISLTDPLADKCFELMTAKSLSPSMNVGGRQVRRRNKKPLCGKVCSTNGRPCKNAKAACPHHKHG